MMEAEEKNGSESDATGASIFDPVLCEIAYTWFCPRGGLVLDPFAGGSVRGIVAAKLGRRYTGIDLRAEQIAANEKQAARICPDASPRWLLGDSRQVAELAPAEYDFIFSCPPYFDLERYSDDARDLSTMEHGAFLEAYGEIISGCLSMLKPNRFAMFVVGDCRDKAGYYRNLPGETVYFFEECGARLYNQAVLITAVGSLPIRAAKQFKSSRKLGSSHQYVLVFCKGDPKLASDDCGPVDIVEQGEENGKAWDEE